MSTIIPLSGGTGTLFRHADIVPQSILPRLVDVWVPPYISAGARLPTIYMHDGQNLFDPAIAFAGVDWGIGDAMLQVMAESGIPGGIVVGVWNSEQRWRDYAPLRPMLALRNTPQWETMLERAGGVPESDAYLRFLVCELKPLIDRAYPTLPDREHTFIMGSSMGGLISLYAIEQYPEVFGGAACVSTHWPAGGSMLVDAMGAALPPAGRHRLYFDYGTKTLDSTYEPFQQRMDGHLRAAGYREGVDWETHKFPGAEHSERSWRKRAHIPLRFLLAQ